MKIFTRNGYISAWGDLPFGDELTEAAYNNLLSVIRSKPVSENGYDYRLKADLTWELYELPEIPEEGEDATLDDALGALAELGVE